MSVTQSISSSSTSLASADAYDLPTPDSPLRLRTKFAFGLTTIFGVMVTSTGQDVGGVPYVVVFISVIGMLCVDWLKLFELPAVVAYAAMTVAAVYCVSNFIQDGDDTNTRMIAVAELLVFAQAILMLQGKTQRLFEQLIVFAILNCVVAAVFNDAFNYAIWMFPLTITLGIALSLLAADCTVETTKANNPTVHFFRKPSSDGSRESTPTAQPASIDSLTRAGLAMPWIAAVVVFPAIASLSVLFFFGLPRRTEASRGGKRANTTVGFSDTLQIGQIGQMLQNSQRVMRVSFENADTRKNYPIESGIYLRGRVLERYEATDSRQQPLGTWQANVRGGTRLIDRLPDRDVQPPSFKENLPDPIHVHVEMEPARTASLFCTAPFYWIQGSQPVRYMRGRWTLQRNKTTQPRMLQRHAAIEYAFGTTGFDQGEQTPWIRFDSETRQVLRPKTSRLNRKLAQRFSAIANQDDIGFNMMTADDLDYLDTILDYPKSRIPTARRLANEVIAELPSQKRDPIEIARAMQFRLRGSSRYQYTLDLSQSVQMELDPIEQFLLVDRRGHCQYFASALVMMLRSQGIPARIVVGYHSDEFSELGEYILIRQSHAHAWVEALFNASDIPAGELPDGQQNASHYWLRLDPTPGGGGVPSSASASQVLDMAQSLWDDYVVEMDPKRQRNALLTNSGLSPMTQSYRGWIDRVKELAIRINAGEVSGIGGGRLFSPAAAFGAIACTFALLAIMRLKLPKWWRRRFGHDKSASADVPTVPFYADVMKLLQRVAPERRPGQTARHYVDNV
ncbi:MAG: DUF3488 and transglutaminase-like domain-containing protein, partial [Planctomycetota bacterium]